MWRSELPKTSEFQGLSLKVIYPLWDLQFDLGSCILKVTSVGLQILFFGHFGFMVPGSNCPQSSTGLECFWELLLPSLANQTHFCAGAHVATSKEEVWFFEEQSSSLHHHF